MSLFKEEFTLDERKDESCKILNKYPNRIPVIVEKIINSNIVEITNRKFLVPIDLTLGQFMFVIKKRLKFTPEKALFLFINSKLIPISHTMGDIYDKNKDEDGFLYIGYGSENTYGASNC